MNRRLFLQRFAQWSAGAALMKCTGSPDMQVPEPDRLVDSAQRALEEYRRELHIDQVRVHLVDLTKPDYGMPKDHPLSEFRLSTMMGKWNSTDHPRGGWPGPYSGQTGMSIIEVRTRDGLRGFGVAGGGLPMKLIAEQHLAQAIKGRNPFDVLDIWDQMYDVTVRFGRMGVAVMAISGIDLRHEYEIAAPKAGLSPPMTRQAQANALEMAFLSKEEKRALLLRKAQPA